MPSRQIYKLIESAEQETKRGNLDNSIKYYKQTLKQINEISKDTIKDDLPSNVIEAVLILQKDITETIRDIQNILDIEQEAATPPDKTRAPPRITTKPSVQSINRAAHSRQPSNSTNFNSDYLGSMYLKMNPSVNNIGGTKMWESNISTGRTGSPNDPFLLGIMNKMENNMVAEMTRVQTVSDSKQTQIQIEQAVHKHVEQFKREVAWYEQKKFVEYDTKMKQLEKENKKLQSKVEWLRLRWDSLVESAKERRNK